MRRMRVVKPVRPAETGTAAGLHYSLWLPTAAPRGAVVILHGAGSSQESHYDFARALIAAGLAALAFDARGHGQSGAALDGRALQDVAGMADLARERCGDVPLALRGSSMGGYLALTAAEASAAQAVVAICPASEEGLLRGLRDGRFTFAADRPGLEALLEAHPVSDAVAALRIPVLLLHAEGDEQVPVAHSRELAGQLVHPHSRLVVVPGGHHRSIQHDEELQAVALRWLQRALLSPLPS